MKALSFFRLYRRFRGLLPHLRNRYIVTFRNFIGAKTYYPSEGEHDHPPVTISYLKHIESRMRRSGNWRNYNWDTVFEKEKKSREIAQVVSSVVPLPDSSTLDTHVRNLQSHGFSKINEKNLTLDQVSSVHEYLIDKLVYPSHAAHWSSRPPSNRKNIRENGSLYGSYDIGTILRAPGLAKLISDLEIMKTISDYFGCVPTICSVNLFWSFYQHGKAPGVTQQFHRDVDDYRSSNFFCFLTDTTDSDGAYFHIEKTHSYDAISKIFDSSLNQTLDPNLNPIGRDLSADDFFCLPFSHPHGHGYDLLYEHFFSQQKKTVSGVPGAPLLTDGYGLHKGSPPAVDGGDRLLFWTTYSLTNDAINSTSSNKHSFLNVKLPPWRRAPYSALSSEFGDDEVTRYVLRNVVDFR